MTQTRPAINPDLIPEVEAWADKYSKETGIRISVTAAVNFLIRRGLNATIKGDGSDENST